ncbi:lytic transglycosylase domain-containing protein [Aureimonas sp. Leaf427]
MQADSPSAARASIDAHVAEAAHRFGIPAAWIRAVMRAESGGDRAAVSPKGAMGLMQIMPATWDDLSARHALGSDPFDPRANILAGAAYLRELHDRYGAPGFLAAYNAGPGRYEASLRGRPLPAETIAYLAMLTPAIDGQTAPLTGRPAVADPQAWRSAALFVSRAAGRGDDRTGATGETRIDAATVPADAEVATALPPRESLFVTRQRTGEAP